MLNTSQLSLLADAKASLAPVTAAGKRAAGVKVTTKKLPTDAQCSGLKVAAFNGAINRRRLAASLFSVLGATPTLEAFDMATRAVKIGYMAGALAKSVKGDIDDKAANVLFGQASALLFDYASLKAASIPEGKLGRRNEAQDKAAASVRSSLSQLLAIAGITSPVAGGADSSKTRKPRMSKENETAAAPADAGKVVPTGQPLLAGKVKSVDDLIKYASVQATAMSRSLNTNAKLTDNDGRMLALQSAIGDFATAINKLAAKKAK